MTESDPVVTVVTPAYNEEEYIEQTLQSVERQTYDRIEHIVIDDGSTDSTREILDRYKDRYRLKIISQENRGQAEAVNRGFELSAGDIVIWLNADDILFSKDTVRTVVNAFSENPDTDLLYANHAVIDEETNLKSLHVPVPWYDSTRLRRWCFGAFIFMRKSVVEEFKLDPSYDYALDYEFYLRLDDEGKNFKYVNENLLGFRIHADTKSQKGSEQMKAEGDACREAYSQSSDTRYRVERIVDHLLNKLLRVYGVFQLLSVYNERDRLVFPDCLDDQARAVYNQLVTLSPRSKY